MAAPDQYQYEAGYDYDYDDEYEDDEDMPATERELAEDAQWKLIQKNTFTRWANEHLKTVSKNIADLEMDLGDGLRLIALVEVLSGKKFKKMNKRPNFRTQKLENVTMCMKFLEEEEGIRIVNIDSTDIVDAKLKLILGLIWTLILHYSISMPMWEEEEEPAQKDRTPKQRLLQWVQSKVPDKPIKNFTTDWNDGRAIGALVDAVAPGMCPDWEDWDPRAAKKNATEAMDAAEEWLDVPQLIRPEDMVHPKVDELSMMTYLSQFPNAKLKPGAPLRPRTNAARVRAYGPGIEPTGNCVGAPARFIVETFSAGRGEVEVLVLNPRGQQITCEVIFNNDRNLTYSCVYTPTMEGQYRVIVKFAGREIPKSPYSVGVESAPGDASKCYAQGPGIEKTGNMVNKKTYFEIFTKDAGVGVVDVAVLDPHGRKDTVRPTVNKQSPEVWYCEYTATEEGLHSVNIFFAGKAIPNSPYPVSIAPDGGMPIDPSKVGPATSAPPVDGARATMSPVRRGPCRKPDEGKAAPPGKKEPAPEGKPDPAKPGDKPKDDNAKKQWQPKKAEPKKEPEQAKKKKWEPKKAPKPVEKEPEAAKQEPEAARKDVEPAQKEPEPAKMEPAPVSKIPKPSEPAKKDEPQGAKGKPWQVTKPEPKQEPEPVKKKTWQPKKAPEAKEPEEKPGRKWTPGKPRPKPEEKPDLPEEVSLKPVKRPEPAQPDVAKEEPTKEPKTIKKEMEPPKKAPEPFKPGQLPKKELEPATEMPEPIKKKPWQPKKAPEATEPEPKPGRKWTPGKPRSKPEEMPDLPEEVHLKPVKRPEPAEPELADVEPAKKEPKPVTDQSEPVKEVPKPAQKEPAPKKEPEPAKKPEPGKKAWQPKKAPEIKEPEAKPGKKWTPGKPKPRPEEKPDLPEEVLLKPVKRPEPPQPEVPVVEPIKEEPVCDVAGPITVTPTEPPKDEPDKATDSPAPKTDMDKPKEDPAMATVAPIVPIQAAPTGKPRFKDPERPVDAKKCYCSGRGIQPKGVRVGDQADFKVHTEGAGAGDCKVQVIGPGGVDVPCRVKKTGQNLYECVYAPQQPGNYVINVTYATQHVTKSPFKVTVGPFKDSRIRAYGPGLLGGVVGYPALFTVETNGETGALGFSIEGPSQAKIDCKDNGDGSADITYWPTAPGEYAVHILCNEEDIPKSPYMAQVVQRGNFDPTKVVASGPGLEKEGNVVNRWAEFTVDARAAGKAPLSVTCVDADLNPVEVIIKDNHDGTFACRYMPRCNAKHVVTVTWGSVAIPKSPFRVFVSEASNPGKVRVYGPAVEQPVKTFSPTHLVVDCSQAGPGDVAIALTDERGVDVPVHTTDMKDNTFRIDFEPQTAGPYLCSVFFAEQEVPSSPYKINVQPSVDVGKVKVEGLEDRVFMEATTDFTVNAQALQRTGSGKVRGVITGPSGARTEALTTNNHDGTYKCMYTPVEEGPTTVDVTYEGLAVPKSPFAVSVVPGCDPSRVRAYGPGLEGGYTNRPQTFTVETRGAGQGGLGLAVEGPSEAKMTCCDNRDGSCTVEYFPTKPGDYEITIKFADQHIPGSVFHVPMVDEINPGKVRCHGPGLDPKGVKAGEPAPFVVDASEAGEAPLEVVTTDQQGRKRPAQITPRGQGVYDCVYYPEVEGNIRVDVNYAAQKVPSSPYNVRVHPAWDAKKVKVTGEGVKPHGVKASLPARFRVDTRNAGFAPLDVLIQDPEGRPVRPTISDNGDGTYNVEYLPEDVGVYNVTVTFGGQHVPGSPFRVQTVPSGRAGMVKMPDDIPSTIPVNEECVIQVNTSGAGEGNITCRIRCNSDADVDIDIVDNGDGTVSLMYTPRVPGAYTLNIKFGGQPVPNGEFTQMAEEDMIRPDQVDAVHAAPPGGAYHPVDFCIPVGPIFNFVSAVVTQPSGRKAYPKIEDNKDGTVTIRYNPTETGLHELAINYNNQPIQGSPFKFHVDAIDSGFVTAYGPGLSHGISGQPAHFTIVTKDAGAGGLSLAVEGPSKAEIQCVDNKDGSCSVSYIPTVPGEYNIIIKFADKHISGSPFTAKITSPTGDQKRAMLSVGSSSEVSLKVTETDIGNLTATIRSPSGMEEPCILKRLANGHLGISFTPREIGEHLVNVYRHGQHIPNSPFKIYVGESEIGNASKVKVTGRGCVEGMANQVNEFTINTKEAGYGGLSLSIEGPSKADIECHDNEDGSCRVTYKPTEPGNYIVNVKFADEHVPGSPFLVKIGGEPSGRITERITRQREAADVTHIGSQCELSLKIPGTSPYDMEASVMAPSGVTEMCEILDLQDGHYSIKFVPKEMGIHTVSVRHKGIHIPGSPFQFTVGPITDGGAHKVRALGPGLERAEVNKPADFNIYTREAGAGGLSIAIEGPSKAEIDFQDRKDGSCGVTYYCSEPGEYLASVKFNDMHIPDSPFKVYVSPSSVDAQKLTIQSLQEQGLQINKPASFTVDFNGAQGKLDARVVAPSGAEDEAILQEVDKDRYAVRFIPHENGVHYIHVRLNGSHIPGSPFKVLVGQQDADPSRVRAHGEGLSRGRTGQQCKFIVNTVNAGSGALAVTVDGPSKVQLNCREVEEGYEFTYTPTAPGDYLITIKYAGNTHIPGSPFKARIEGGAIQPGGWTEQSQVVVETVTKSSTTQSFAALQQTQQPSDASKVVTRGVGLKKAMVNKETTFAVDCSQAGLNMLMVGVMGPHHPCEEIKITHKGRNQYNVSYVVKERGDYVMFVKWGEDHVPGSPFHIAV